MKVAIIGRSQLLYFTTFRLLEKGHTVPLIITAPASPEYSKNENDFKVLAADINARFFLAKSLNNSVILSAMRDLDIGVSINWISIVKKEQIDCFGLGILNAHMGDLPRYRGNACPNWAIINGEKEVILSIHLMEGEGLDCGRIIIQDRFAVTNETYIRHIYEWAEKVTPGLFAQALELLEKDPDYRLRYAHPASTEGLRCYPRIPEDSRIDWSKPASDIHRLIRASGEPFSGAYCYLNGKEKMIILEAELFNDGERYCAIPGQISSISDANFIVITGNGKLKITRWSCKVKVGSIRQRLK